ncbi:MAG: helix-turn-helix domain-containing protein, partial [Candidatus Omnitrophota bacterium]
MGYDRAYLTEHVSRLFSAIRGQLNMSKNRFAKNIGISNNFLGDVEKGLHLPSPEIINSLVEYVNNRIKEKTLRGVHPVQFSDFFIDERQADVARQLIDRSGKNQDYPYRRRGPIGRRGDREFMRMYTKMIMKKLSGKMTVDELTKELGVLPVTVYRYKSGLRVPDRNLRNKIEELSAKYGINCDFASAFDPVKIGSVLARLREKSKLTLSEAAALIDKKGRNLLAIESGEYRLNRDKLRDLARLYGVTVGYIIEESGVFTGSSSIEYNGQRIAYNLVLSRECVVLSISNFDPRSKTHDPRLEKDTRHTTVFFRGYPLKNGSVGAASSISARGFARGLYHTLGKNSHGLVSQDNVAAAIERLQSFKTDPFLTYLLRKALEDKISFSLAELLYYHLSKREEYSRTIDYHRLGIIGGLLESAIEAEIEAVPITLPRVSEEEYLMRRVMLVYPEIKCTVGQETEGFNCRADNSFSGGYFVDKETRLSPNDLIPILGNLLSFQKAGLRATLLAGMYDGLFEITSCPFASWKTLSALTKSLITEGVLFSPYLYTTHVNFGIDNGALKFIIKPGNTTGIIDEMESALFVPAIFLSASHYRLSSRYVLRYRKEIWKNVNIAPVAPLPNPAVLLHLACFAL